MAAIPFEAVVNGKVHALREENFDENSWGLASKGEPLKHTILTVA